MFDTFDVIMPRLLLPPKFSIRQHETAFGLDSTRGVYFGEVRLGRVVPLHVTFGDVEAWTGAFDRAYWDVVLLYAEANAASENDQTWAEFLGGLRALLDAHTRWRITCESDCNQYPVRQLFLTAGTTVELLDSYRETRHYPIAFFSESPAVPLAR